MFEYVDLHIHVLSHTKVTVYVLKNWIREFSFSSFLLFQVLNANFEYIEKRVILHTKLTVYALKMWVPKPWVLRDINLYILAWYNVTKN